MTKYKYLTMVFDRLPVAHNSPLLPNFAIPFRVTFAFIMLKKIFLKVSKNILYQKLISCVLLPILRFCYSWVGGGGSG